MKRVGFLGCGKIGGTMLRDLVLSGEHSVAFVQDPFYKKAGEDMFPVVGGMDEELLANTDLVVEAATSAILTENISGILKHCDLMIFSVTSFSDEAFYEYATALARQYGRKIYLPHGAILGIDGIGDGSRLISSIKIETTKNPNSLGRADTERTVVYEGTTRGACKAYPRNVNVHATVALAGIGFDRTRSAIVSDPAVDTNSHKITVDGEGIHFEVVVSSFSSGGVTGKYTPYSAVASLHRILDNKSGFCFV